MTHLKINWTKIPYLCLFVVIEEKVEGTNATKRGAVKSAFRPRGTSRLSLSQFP